MTNELWQCHCQNRGINFFFQQLWQWHCRKWEEKKSYKIYERVKKKVVMSTIFLQHFHNKLHIISYYQFKKICDKLIVAMVLSKLGEKKICENLIVAMPLPKQGNKKKISNCGNGIAENGRKKKIVVAEITCEELKKKNYVYNIFTIFSQQITGNQLLLVKI